MFLYRFSIFCPNVQSPKSFVFCPLSFVLIPFQDRRQRTEDRGWRTKASDAHTNAPHLGEAALLPLLPAPRASSTIPIAGAISNPLIHENAPSIISRLDMAVHKSLILTWQAHETK